MLADLIRDLSASEIPGLQEKMRYLAKDCDPEGSADLWAPLLRRAELQQGSIHLRLDRKALAERLGIAADRIDSAARRISASFQMQRRGVEARIILGAAVPQVDPVLAKNILAARRWYAAIKAGASFGDLAAREKTTASRIQQVIGLAFLAPEVLNQVAAGRQPVAFTSEWVKRRQNAGILGSAAADRRWALIQGSCRRERKAAHSNPGVHHRHARSLVSSTRMNTLAMVP